MQKEHFDKVIFFQVGTFYELFGFDSMLGAELFGLKVCRLPFFRCRADPPKIHSRTQAGFPLKEWETWATKFMAQGFTVLRVDQAESEGGHRARRVGEYMSAGTVVDPQLLPSSGSNFIMCVATCALGGGQVAGSEAQNVFVGVTFADLTLLETHVAAFIDDGKVLDWMHWAKSSLAHRFAVVAAHGHH